MKPARRASSSRRKSRLTGPRQVTWPAASGPRPRVVITKHERTLRLYDGEEEVMRFEVVLGRNPADKVREGDLATPEGRFYVCYKNPRSRYHRFLGLSYPGLEDAQRGLRQKLIHRAQFRRIAEAIGSRRAPPWDTPLGGEVGLHGPCPNRTWTHGCVAMSVEQIERLYELLQPGDEVTILP
jgi:murein L,D-transpeptidase YafK